MSAFEKPHRTIREHKKSRLGCFTCKRRKVKCDQGQPVCGACHLRKTACQYPENHRPEESHAVGILVDGAQSSALMPRRNGPSTELEPLLPSSTATDMKFLWFFTAHTSQSLLAKQYDENGVGKIIQTLVVREALEHPFLMKTLFVIAGLHMQHLNQAVDPRTIHKYRAESLQGYRHAIREAEPNAFSALLANSVLLATVSCNQLRDLNSSDPFILHWLSLWRGIRCVNNLFGEESAQLSGGIDALLVRPTLQVEDVSTFIPSRLKYLLCDIKEGDREFEVLGAYEETLFFLGSLYKRLSHGDHASTALLILTWITYLPEGFIQAARQQYPRALITLGYYSAFFKILQNMWWIEGVSDLCIQDLYARLGSDWRREMEIPLLVAKSRGNSRAAELLLSEISRSSPQSHIAVESVAL